MEQNKIMDLIKDQALNALVIDAIQNHITDEDIRKATNKILNAVLGKEETPKKNDLSDVPVHWHPYKNGARRRNGKSIILCDGVTKEGFLSNVAGDDFLGQYHGYLGDRIRRGEKIFNTDMKEYFIVEE